MSNQHICTLFLNLQIWHIAWYGKHTWGDFTSPLSPMFSPRRLLISTVMSQLEAPCAKTSWRALLFRAILGITGALIVCFDIWWSKQVNNNDTGFVGHHCDFEQHVPCLAVHVCMNSVKFIFEAPGASILWGGATIPWQCADSFGGRFY